MWAVRGNDIGMIFQEPMTSLDPLYTVGSQIVEAVMLHQGLRGRPARQAAVEALDAVGIPEPARRIDSYPYQMSGGMRQRVMIATAPSCRPDLLIADEPTTALDVTIQARILDPLHGLSRTRGMALLLITHNLGIVAQMCDRVLVMHRGRIVEAQSVRGLFAHPTHPYTRALLHAIPRLDSPPSSASPFSATRRPRRTTDVRGLSWSGSVAWPLGRFTTRPTARMALRTQWCRVPGARTRQGV